MNFLDIKPSTSTPAAAEHPMIAALTQAAARFNLRQAQEPRNAFLSGKAETCLDMASKLKHFGAFASPAQEGFAAKLVGWSQPRGAASNVPAVVRLPRLFALMQRLAKLEIGVLTISRKNQDSLVWVKHSACEGVVGKIEDGVLTLFFGRLAGRIAASEIREALERIEIDPEAAAVRHGRASGRCAVCSRDLTDPESIARGLGPICAERF